MRKELNCLIGEGRLGKAVLPDQTSGMERGNNDHIENARTGPLPTLSGGPRNTAGKATSKAARNVPPVENISLAEGGNSDGGTAPS